MANVMTYAEAINIAIEVMGADHAEAVDRLKTLQAQLAKRNSGSKGLTKTQKANEALMDIIERDLRDPRHRARSQLPQALLLQDHQRILAQVAHKPRRVDEELRLLSDRDVRVVQKDQFIHSEVTLRADGRRQTHGESVHYGPGLFHRLHADRHMARSKQQIHRLRSLERADHHDLGPDRTCL